MSHKKSVSEILRDLKLRNCRLTEEKLSVIKSAFFPKIKVSLAGYDKKANILSHPDKEAEDVLQTAISKYLSRNSEISDNGEYSYFYSIVRNAIHDIFRTGYMGSFEGFLDGRLRDKKNEFTQIYATEGSLLWNWWRGRGGDWENRKDIKKYPGSTLDELNPEHFDEVTKDIHKKLNRKKSAGLYVQYYSKYLLELEDFKYMQLRTLAEMEKFGARMPIDKSAGETQEDPKSVDTNEVNMDLYESKPTFDEFKFDSKVNWNDFKAVYPKPSHRLVFYLKGLGIGYEHIADILSILAGTPKWRDKGITPLGRSAAQDIITRNEKKLPNDSNYFFSLNSALEKEFGEVKMEPIVEKYLEKK